MNIGKCVVVNILILLAIAGDIILQLIDLDVVEILNSDAVFFEEPLFELIQ